METSRCSRCGGVKVNNRCATCDVGVAGDVHRLLAGAEAGAPAPGPALPSAAAVKPRRQDHECTRRLRAAVCVFVCVCVSVCVCVHELCGAIRETARQSAAVATAAAEVAAIAAGDPATLKAAARQAAATRHPEPPGSGDDTWMYNIP